MNKIRIFDIDHSLCPQELKAGFSLLAHPALRRQLLQSPGQEKRQHLAATIWGQVVGLLVLTLSPKTKEAELLSLYVKPAWRQKKVAKTLWTEAESWLKKHQAHTCRFQYIQEENDTLSIDQLLTTFGWPPLKLEWVVARSELESAKEDRYLSHPPRFHRGFEYFPWAELTHEEEQCLRNKQNPHMWYPPHLSPFVHEDRIHYPTSLGLRFQGKLIGWIVSHLMSHDVIRYSSLFVREDFQSRGHSIRLLIRALQLQLETGIAIASLQMKADNTRMIHFVERKIKPYLQRYYYASVSEKRL